MKSIFILALVAMLAVCDARRLYQAVDIEDVNQALSVKSDASSDSAAVGINFLPDDASVSSESLAASGLGTANSIANAAARTVDGAATTEATANGATLKGPAAAGTAIAQSGDVSIGAGPRFQSGEVDATANGQAIALKGAAAAAAVATGITDEDDANTDAGSLALAGNGPSDASSFSVADTLDGNAKANGKAQSAALKGNADASTFALASAAAPAKTKEDYFDAAYEHSFKPLLEPTAEATGSSDALAIFGDASADVTALASGSMSASAEGRARSAAIGGSAEASSTSGASDTPLLVLG